MSSPTSFDPTFLAPTHFVDADHPDVVTFAAEACAGARGERERAVRLYHAVRERFRYDPYTFTTNPEDFKASAVLRRERSFCIPKAVVLAAAARAVGIGARLGFADVKNHLASEKLIRYLGSDLFVFHGYAELWIEGRPVKASPAFNASLCERFGVAPLAFDGVHDALLQPFDGAGRPYMQYVTDRGLHLDLPFDAMLKAIGEHYGPRGHAVADEAFG